MGTPSRKPFKLIQIRLDGLIASPEARLALYRRVLDRWIGEVERGRAFLRTPRPLGLRQRLPGKPFHSTPELFFQEGGRTCFELPRERLAIGPRQGALIPAGMPHGEAWRGLSFLNIIGMFQPESFSFHLGYLEDGKGRLRCGPIDRFPSSARFEAVRYAGDLFALGGEDGRYARQVRRGLHLALLSLLRREIDPARLRPRPPSRDTLLERCREVIEVHFAQMDFSVAWAARELGCSPDHLSRRFRSGTGERLIAAIHRRRIAHARDLLREADMSMAEVAWACGFRQPSYFDRIFRRLMGTTPREFVTDGESR